MTKAVSEFKWAEDELAEILKEEQDPQLYEFLRGPCHRSKSRARFLRKNRNGPLGFGPACHGDKPVLVNVKKAVQMVKDKKAVL